MGVLRPFFCLQTESVCFFVWEFFYA